MSVRPRPRVVGPLVGSRQCPSSATTIVTTSSTRSARSDHRPGARRPREGVVDHVLEGLAGGEHEIVGQIGEVLGQIQGRTHRGLPGLERLAEPAPQGATEGPDAGWARLCGEIERDVRSHEFPRLPGTTTR